MKRKIIITIIALFAIVLFLEAQYHVFHRANRYWHNNGTFSTDGRIQSIGTSNGLRLAYAGNRYIDMVANDDGELEFEVDITRAGENYSTMQFWTGWSNVDENRKGVINIFASRDTICSSPGGSPDMGMQIAVRNRVVNSSSYHLRGLESIASNKEGGATCGDVIAAYFSAESLSGCTSTAIKTVQINYDQSGNVNTDHCGLYVLCNSQSNVGTNRGIYITTASWNQTREYAMFIDTNAGSWTNGVSFNGTITNAFDFENTDGTNAAGFNASYATTGAGAVDGYIKVDVGGNTLYIYLWPGVPST